LEYQGRAGSAGLYVCAPRCRFTPGCRKMN
jgi:hypothetical protein